MSWVERFYSRTGDWWGPAESGVDAEDRRRAAIAAELVPSGASVLELGCGYGSTALAMVDIGFAVTGIDVSDRIDAAARVAPTSALTFVRGDFFEATFDRRFEVVCYWDGFGVGTDDDQRRLLRRVADEWLEPDGVCVLDVFDPEWWAEQHGFEETKRARPGDGYHFSLAHRREFDAEARRAEDIWWELGSEERLTQSLRCYTPTELAELVDGVLSISEVRRGADRGGPSAPSYVAILGQPAPASTG